MIETNSRRDTHSLHVTSTLELFYPIDIKLQYIKCHLLFHSYTSMNAITRIISGIASQMTTKEQREKVKTQTSLLFNTHTKS